jgi:hypothetical protein
VNPRPRINLGKRAGVASGLLGVLCVLAEFCFLFPDLLVTGNFPSRPIPLQEFADSAAFSDARLSRPISGACGKLRCTP